MTEEDLHRQVKQHIGGLWCCATMLCVLMDQPDMTIEKLRETAAAQTMREQVEAFRRWMHQAVELVPDDRIPPEEKNFLHHWYREKERSEDLSTST